MERSGNQKQKVGFKTVQVRLNPDHYEKLKEAPGKTCSEKIRALIDAEHYLSLKEITVACVKLKDAIYEAEHSNDYSYSRIREAGNEICRLLLTK